MPKVDFIRDPSLVLYLPFWKLDGPNFTSEDAHGHTATATTASWSLQGRVFDGASGKIVVSDATAIQDIFDGGGTIEYWIRAASAGEGPYGHISLKIWEFIVRDLASGRVKLQFSATFSGDNGVWATATTELDINTWYHIAVTYDNGHVNNNPIVYVNTSSVALSAGQPTGTRTTDVGTALHIGNRAADDRTFDGVMGEARFYNRILSPLEIQHNYLTTKWRYT